MRGGGHKKRRKVEEEKGRWGREGRARVAMKSACVLRKKQGSQKDCRVTQKKEAESGTGNQSCEGAGWGREAGYSDRRRAQREGMLCSQTPATSDHARTRVHMCVNTLAAAELGEKARKQTYAHAGTRSRNEG
eukprot:6204739-Pleurochrysis_carterae.AAC.1